MRSLEFCSWIEVKLMDLGGAERELVLAAWRLDILELSEMGRSWVE